MKNHRNFLRLLILLAFPSLSGQTHCAHSIIGNQPPSDMRQFRIGNWYDVTEIRKDVFVIREPAAIDANFFILKHADRALFIDSGIGLSDKVARELLVKLDIRSFDVLNTHSHYDHVGLNHLANNVAIGEIEWNKFKRLDEVTQLERFLKLEPGPRPDGFDPKRKRVAWKPSNFVQSGKTISFGPFVLVPILTAGHTEGHFIYHEPSLNLLFVGDLVYDGTLYLHLSDSSFSSYKRSIEVLASLIDKLSGPTLLPCHNSIPLDVTYPKRVLEVLQHVQSGTLRSQRIEPGNTLFEEGRFFEENGVKLIVRLKEVP